ncbi:MAG: hypothetical protein B7X55_03050 [Rhodobacterales bacterium 34-62-10]|nr:MAG: hypothetical protein B7X55_03050 [Rhodobacterales bacterium 34-62-10]
MKVPAHGRNMDIVTPRAQQYPEQAATALARLQTLVASDPALNGAKIENMLRLVPGRRAIIAGWLKDKPAVFRVSLHPEETASFLREWQELQRASTYMNSGKSQIAAPMTLGAGAEVLVVQRAQGHQMLDFITRLTPPDRIAQVTEATTWLARYQAPTLETSPTGWKKWFSRAQAALATQTHPELLEVEQRVLRRMKTLGRNLEATGAWRTAIGHGDFHPNNLMVGPDKVLRGIDLGGSGRIPIYKDMARFLTHLSRRGVTISGTRRFGVDAATYDAFVAACNLDEVEATLCLPFMICFETLIRVEHPAMPARRVAHGVKLAKSLLADLRRLD